MFAFVLIGLMLALASLEAAPTDPGAPGPNPATILAATGALALAVFAVGLLLGAILLRRSPAFADDDQRLFRRVGCMAKAYRLLVLAAYAAVLFLLDWSALAVHWAGGKTYLALAFLLAVAPLVVLLVLSWTALYWADRRLRAVLFVRAGVLAPTPWSLIGYLVFLARQYLLVGLVPLAAVLACHDLVAWLFGPDAEPWQGLTLLVCLGLAAFLAGPWIRLCWPTRPLPDGDLRQRLLALACRARVRIADVLVWRTHHSIANGCMVGSIGPLRYILITDALLAALPNEELEAVFAHEMGHVKHRHVGLYLVLAVGAMGAAVLAAHVAGALTGSPEVVQVALVVVALAYWWLLFGFVSRRCELESDLYAVRAAACPVGCTPPDAAAGGAAETICEHRVAAFTSALRRIARLNGAAETARGWRHWSVARRCRFLERLLAEPGCARRFERFMTGLKVGVVMLALALVAAAAAAVLAAEIFLQTDHPEDPAGPDDVFPPAHRWIVRFVDRHEMDALALGAPQFHGHADAALEFHHGRLTCFGRDAPPANDNVVVQNPRRHAVAVHPQAERPRLDLPPGAQVHVLDTSVRGRIG